MSIHGRALASLSSLLFAALAAPSSGATPDWWDAQWPARRSLEIRGARRSGYAPLTAHAQFLDFVPLKADASDVRVVSERGNPVPFRVVFYHPRLYCLIAFEPESTSWRGFVYYGNPKAPKTDDPWRPRSGLLLTTYRRKGNACNNWREMQRTVRGSLEAPDGAGFRPAIFDGFNPFGSSVDFVSVYDGWFYAPRTGTYQFSTISDNASFVFIDEKMVTQWPGRHGIQGGRHGQRKGSVRLQAGPHRVQYYHVQFTGQTVAELAWWLPGDDRPRLMQARDYLPAYKATIGLEERRDEPFTLEFSAVPVQTLEYGGHHYIQWKFGNFCGAPGKPAETSHWDFGNGVTTSQRNPLVWFLHPGDYEVALQTTVARNETHTLKKWVRVADLIQLDATEKPGAFDRAAQEIAGYPMEALSDNDRDAVLSLLMFRQMHDEIEKVCRAWLDKTYRNRGPVPAKAVLELGRVLTDVRGNPTEAEKAYEEAVRHLQPNDPLGYQVYLALGELRVRRLKKHDQAIAPLKMAEKGVKEKNRIERRRIAVALGDAHRAQLDRDEAATQYKRAERMHDPSRTDASLRSSFGLTVEAFLGREEYEAALEKLEAWADRFPTDKLDGYWSLLMGRCLVGLDRQEEAAEELALAAKLNPFGNHTRDVLEQLGYTYAWLRRYKDAIEALRTAANLFDDPAKKKHLESQIALIQREARRSR